MTILKMPLQAIRRNAPAGAVDGGCDDFVNLRFSEGAWRPIGPKKTLYHKPEYSKIHIHRQDDFENWIGWNGLNLHYYDPSDETVLQDLGTLDGSLYDIVAVKNFLVVTHSAGTSIWLFNGETYDAVALDGLEKLFDVELSQDPDNLTEPEFTDWIDFPVTAEDASQEVKDQVMTTAIQSFLGKYYEKLANLSGKGQMYGAVSYVVALRLFDGSYILHTVPRFYRFFHPSFIIQLATFLGIPAQLKFKFGGAAPLAKAKIDASGLNFEGLSKIVSSVDLFFSKAEQIYDISEDTVTEEFYQQLFIDAAAVGTNYVNLNGDQYFPVNTKFKDLIDPVAFYKVASIDLSALEANGDFMEGTMDLDFDDFYSGYAARNTLPVDGYSHHSSTGQANYVYNGRLVLGNTALTLSPSDILPLASTQSRWGNPATLDPIIYAPNNENLMYAPNYEQTYPGKVIITLQTENGIKTIVDDITLPVYREVTYGFVILQGITGYFDARASKIQVLLSDDGGVNFYEIANIGLQKSKYHNYSYAPFSKFFTYTAAGNIIPAYPGEEPRRLDINFEGYPIRFQFTNLGAAVPIPANDATVKNNNGRQVSNVGNPLFFDVANFDEVGNGTIIAFGSNTDPISDSQFGAYPLYTFTSQGIWAAQIGTGSVYILSDVPVNGEVLLSKELKVDLSLGTVYATLDGLKILSGRNPVEISENVEGLPETTFLANDSLQQYFGNAQAAAGLPTLVDGVPFLTYLEGATIGYSKGKDDEEIYVANPDYEYMYMFDLETKAWTKVSTKVYFFINYYPKLYAIGENWTISISDEVPGMVPAYFHTKPLSLGADDVQKKLHRTFLRCRINTSGRYAAFYIFGSDDLLKWEFITGNDRNAGDVANVWNTHTAGSKRFYVFVFASDLYYDPNNHNWIKYIETDFILKWSGKLR